MPKTLRSLRSLIFLYPLAASAFYLPGVAPTSYKEGEKVPLNVNHLTPTDSEYNPNVQSVFSFDYYLPEFHFCAPEGGPKPVSESLGSILFGDRIYTSPFDLSMLKNESCVALCDEATFEPQDAELVNARIKQGYNLNWLIDGLPAGELLRAENEVVFENPGFPLGFTNPDMTEAYLNTHYEIHIDYHDASQGMYRVVGVIVEPSSRDSKCDPNKPMQLSEKTTTNVTWTYTVIWRPSSTTFATRWDKLFHVFDPKIHWFSLVNSAFIVCFLVSIVSTILIRTLRKDIARYNRLDQVALEDLSGTGVMDDTVAEDSGWKLVHGDVFRPPKWPLPLAVLLGNGAQLFMMAGFTIAFACLGFLSPSNRGSLATVMLLLYTLFSFVGGYVAARSYKFFDGQGWKRLFLYTPFIGPLFIFSVFFFLNLFVWARHASGAVPFTTMLVIILIWFLISVPLSVAGSWIAFKAKTIQPPVRTNQIPRQMPPLTTYMRPVPSMLLAGALPFGAIFVELYFIMNSIWIGKVYYMFGFLFLCYGLMIITCASITVLMVYFLLCAENYHWQWRSFFMAGASALYVFAFALLYWVRTLSFSSWTSGVLYLGYSALIAVNWFVLSGTIGFFASWLFVMKIYGSIKVD